LSLLAQLRYASSDDEVLITGPRGAPYWSLAAPEVVVRVVPDDYEYEYRTVDEYQWSYLAAGCSTTEAKQLQARTSDPTRQHKLFPAWETAKQLRERLSALPVPVVSASTQGRNQNYTLITDINEQLQFLSNLQGEVALDLEWTYDKPDPKDNGKLIGINASMVDGNWYLPVIAKEFNRGQWEYTLKGVLRQSSKRLGGIWHNFKADVQQLGYADPLEAFGTPFHDTILMAYIAGEQELGLKDLTKKLLGRNAMRLPTNLETLPMEVAARYGAAGDTRNTLDLYHVLKQKLVDTNQWDLYNDIERPLVPIVASMEQFGIPLDITEVKRLRDDYEQQLHSTEATLLAQGYDFTDESEQKRYVTERYGSDLGTLDQRVLSRISGEWVSTLLGYRQTRTLKRNFLDKHIIEWERNGQPTSYSLYPSFNQAGRDNESGGVKRAPATGRFSSAAPNLQNQPREIRSCFTPPRGTVLVSLDYAALELRVAAAISEDAEMLQAFRTPGGDLHTVMRNRILQHTGKDVGRPTAKNANFNLRYGGQADMLMTIAAKEGAHLDYETAKAIVDVDRKTYTGYWQWFERTVALAKVLGYSETLFGRRRYNSDLTSRDDVRRGHAERAAANHVVQGTAADIIKLAMASIIAVLRYYNAHLAVQVHDELVFWVPEYNAKAFLIAAKGIMESVEIPHLKLVAEGGIGKTWAEAHA
jgi:DNA polymerase I-like protein with 3'-5' exonuclease and polymerase domains